MRIGQNLYKQAKELIPGGTMLLSKRPEMFLPDNWPSYYSKAKGCEVWEDLLGGQSIDSDSGSDSNATVFSSHQSELAPKLLHLEWPGSCPSFLPSLQEIHEAKIAGIEGMFFV